MEGAIARQPLKFSEVNMPRGTVVVQPDLCKGCRFCLELCPKGVLEESESTNSRGYHYPVIAESKDESCINCDFCTIICPEFAIHSEELVDETSASDRLVAD